MCAAGTSCGSPSPIPIPDTPPVENAHSDCASWSPPCTRLSHGESHIETRSPTVCGTPMKYPATNPDASSSRPAAGTRALPRAIPYRIRNRHANTSAGPISLCKKKKASASTTETSTGSVYSTGGMSNRRVSAASPGRVSRAWRSTSQRCAKYPARNSTSSTRISSTGWNPNRLTLASLVPGPEPNSTSSTESPKLASSGTKLSLPKSRSKWIRLAAASTRHPPTTPCAKSTNNRLSRTGSRRLIMRIRPAPVSSRMAGRNVWSPRKPRMLHHRCVSRYAAKNSPIQR